ncbi:MAG: M20/M25/M40 family metallo-hydrolase [Terriglobales bacterium]|jgi:acetylornithine deacetylase/succinyl-diaminopimelate desuccinylase-like protein
MNLTRKDFLSLSGKVAAGAAMRPSLGWPRMRGAAEDVGAQPVVRKIHEHIAREKEKHVASVQADLRQPSVSSWNMGINEMAHRMIDSFRVIGCQEAELVPTDGLPGIWAYHDAGAPKTVVIYMMYDTQPWEKERWSVDPLSATRMSKPPFPEVIVGRGACNDKGPNRFFLNACESILAVNGRLPVNLMFTCDGEEEQGSPHFHQVLDRYSSRLKKANAELNVVPTQDVDGHVVMFLGVKGILEFELEASGAKWGKGPQKQPIHSGAKAILDSPAWRLVDALRTMYDPPTNRILIEGFYDGLRPPNDEEEAMLEELIRQSGSQILAEQKNNARLWINGWSDAEAMRHLLFDTTMNINGMWSGYTGAGAATIVPEKATAKIDFRLVPNQDVATQQKLVQEHLRKHGFGDLEYRAMGGGDEWSQTSVREPLVQSLLAIYRAHHVEPAVWPRSPASTPEAQYTRKLGLPAVRGGMGHGGNEHVDDEYLVIEGTGKVAGIVQAEQSIVDLLFTYAQA